MSNVHSRDPRQIVIIGGGAAGLATAIFTRRFDPHAPVLVLEGARRPGAKILISGGSRCNVTNRVVTEVDYWGGKRTIIRRVLRAFPVPQTIAFFREIGVTLHEEPDGKLFPDSNRSRDVLEAMLRAADTAGVVLRSGYRVTGVSRDDGGFRILTSNGVITASAAVLATGGQSLPKSGSDGAGFAFARALGHTIVPTTPALVPLLLDAEDGRSIHEALAGVSHDVELEMRVDGAISVRLRGPLLWTHFGVSGPVVLNASRHWLRTQLEGRACEVTISFCPGETFERLEAHWLDVAAARPRVALQSTLSELVPASVASALLRRLGIDAARRTSVITRENRRRLVHALLQWPLHVTGSRGYNYAEATAGGVALNEIDPASMESRACAGLFLVGEILDVDGRIGGFNFQWAWASARVAARTIGGGS